MRSVLTALIPEQYAPERQYAIQTLLGVFIGIDCETIVSDRDDVVLTLRGSDRRLVFADGLFRTAPERWLMPESIPQAPLPRFAPAEYGIDAKIISPELPVLFDARRADAWLETDAAGNAFVGFDPFGASFFMLSRYEEVAQPVTDAHGRFPSRADLATREGFLDRPLVNEYAEVVAALLRRTWPALTPRSRSYSLALTHDVDLPFQHAFTSFGRMLLSCGADWIRRRELLGPLRRIAGWARTKGGNPQADPANTFDFIMDLSERRGVVSEFNFIVAHSNAYYDAHYPPQHPWIIDLMRRIHARGHRIGLHASYGSYLDARQTALEFQTLRETCDRIGIHQGTWGGRQHWLRFRTPDTFQNWEDAGLDFDCSLAYEERIGFRGGSCTPYPVFNLRSRRQLRLIERPTAVMDASVTDHGTMNLGFGEPALAAVRKIIESCRRMRGECVILWHNSRLVRPAETHLYQQVLAS